MSDQSEIDDLDTASKMEKRHYNEAALTKLAG